MRKMYRVQQLASVHVAMILCAGFLVESAVAQSQTPSAPCNSKTTADCKQTKTTVTTQPMGTDMNGNTIVQTNTQQTTTTNTTNYGDTTWQGLNWGIGIGTNFNLGSKIVSGAEIDNNHIVRVTDRSSNVGIGFVLEAHYFLKEWLPRIGCMGYNCSDIATGPFVAFEVGTGATATPSASGLITGYVVGWMVGLHHPDAIASKTTNSSWNFGLGLVVNPSTKILGDNFVPNQPVPAGATAIRYITEPRYGLMLLSSFSF